MFYEVENTIADINTDQSENSKRICTAVSPPGFNAWKNKFNRYVKKGEKGIQIIAPAPIKEVGEREKIDKDTGLAVLNENGEPEMERVEYVVPRFRLTTVFDISQTDGEPIPSLKKMNVEGQYNPKDVECIPVENLEVLPSGADWQSRHLESERRKAEIRDRIHKQTEQGQKTAKDYFRPAKPTPSIYDSDLKRVAVYARVSTSSEEQISSIENQTLYYTKKIAETENWNLQDIYSDEGKSGTSLRKRDAFKRMMRDAKDQKMDLIICARAFVCCSIWKKQSCSHRSHRNMRTRLLAK